MGILIGIAQEVMEMLNLSRESVLLVPTILLYEDRKVVAIFYMLWSVYIFWVEDEEKRGGGQPAKSCQL